MKASLLSLSIIVILSSSKLHAQNPSFSIVFDSIYPLVESGNYLQAKELWIRAEKQYVMDPQENFLFLIHALKNNDTRYFKREMKSLIKKHGYHLSIMDTASTLSNQYCDLYREQGVLEWVVQKSHKYYTNWIKKNPKKYYVKQKVEFFTTRDQTTRFYTPPCDTSKSCLTSRESHFENVAIIEAAELASFFIEIQTIPNHIDFGVDVYYPLLPVMHHILENSEKAMNYAWNLWLPYIEKARLDGKIGTELFYIYDEALYHHSGYQFYGLYENAPIKDSKGLEERRNKYGL
jgi:hypothetical protein